MEFEQRAKDLLADAEKQLKVAEATLYRLDGAITALKAVLALPAPDPQE